MASHNTNICSDVHDFEEAINSYGIPAEKIGAVLPQYYDNNKQAYLTIIHENYTCDFYPLNDDKDILLYNLMLKQGANYEIDGNNISIYIDYYNDQMTKKLKSFDCMRFHNKIIIINDNTIIGNLLRKILK